VTALRLEWTLTEDDEDLFLTQQTVLIRTQKQSLRPQHDRMLYKPGILDNNTGIDNFDLFQQHQYPRSVLPFPSHVTTAEYMKALGDLARETNDSS